MACYAAALVKDVEEEMVKRVHNPSDITSTLIITSARLQSIALTNLTKVQNATLCNTRLDLLALFVLYASKDAIGAEFVNDGDIKVTWDWEEDV